VNGRRAGAGRRDASDPRPQPRPHTALDYIVGVTARRSPTNSELVDFLGGTVPTASALQKLKIRYRPYICPFNELIAYIEYAETVYDVGCGSGQFAAVVAEFTGARAVHGIEVDQNLVANARVMAARSPSSTKMSFAHFDGSALPADVGDYELVFMIDVYHHIPIPIRAAFMADLYAKMRPGARLVLKDIDRRSPLVVFNKVHDLVLAGELGHEISLDAAVQTVRSLGFTVLEHRTSRVLWYPHYFVVAQKDA
jgi:2-polyprenyl-3-methyl-5-hydroxy-6-metoxy-1,4-benzoquinol methylase